MKIEDLENLSKTQEEEKHIIAEEEMERTTPNEFRIGVIGYERDGEIDEIDADDEIQEMINELVDEADLGENEEVVIVSNGKDSGVSQIAYDIAVERGYKTVSHSKEGELDEEESIFPVDEEITSPADAQDENFVDYVDAVIRLGEAISGDTARKIDIAERNDVPALESDV